MHYCPADDLGMVGLLDDLVVVASSITQTPENPHWRAAPRDAIAKSREARPVVTRPEQTSNEHDRSESAISRWILKPARESLMFAHRKKPLFPVKVGEVNPKFAQKLLEQFGGRSGEFTAMTEYFVQSFACDKPAIRDMLLDIATEEIGHLEMVGLMVEQLLRGAERESAYENTLFSMMGKGPQFCDSLGNAWTSDWIRASGDIVADLKHNVSAEAGAKMAYDRLIRQTDDPGCKETLNYLMTREISHQRMFLKALDTLGGITAMEGTVKPEAELNTYYNLSRDGRGDQGIGVDERGPWNAEGEWQFVDEPEEKLSAKVEGPGA